MKVKVLCRNPDDYVRETTKDVQRGGSQVNEQFLLFLNHLHTLLGRGLYRQPKPFFRFVGLS